MYAITKLAVKLVALGSLAALALVLGIEITRPPQAQAHAVLERSVPAQDERLTAAPELVEAWYSEPLERALTALQVLDTEGNPVHAGKTLFSDRDPRYAAIVLRPSLGPGIYTAIYKNVSTVDGHQWSGSFSFVFLNPDGSVPAGTAFTPGGLTGGRQGNLPGVGDATLRWFAILSAVSIVGAAAFFVLIARPAARLLEAQDGRSVETSAMAVVVDLTAIAMPILILSLLGQLFLLADRAGGMGTVDDILLHTRTGALWLSRLGLTLAVMLIIAPALRNNAYRAGGRATAIAGLAFVNALGLLITYSLGSHAAVGAGQFWSVGSDFVHFATTALWLGTLLQLPLAFWWTRGRLEGPRRLVFLASVFDRFSWLAVASVALLIWTGAFNGFVQLPTLPSLWETTYGRVLIAKLALILPLLAVAGINALLLRPRLTEAAAALHDRGPERQVEDDERGGLETPLQRLQRALPRTVLAELLLAAAVLASVSVLAQSTTAKGELAQAAARPSGTFSVTQESGDLRVLLSIRPFGIGMSTFTVELQPTDGAVLGDVLDVRLRASSVGSGAPSGNGGAAANVELERAGQPGVWTADAALLTRPGDWRVEARIRRRAADDALVAFSVPEVGGTVARVRVSGGLFDLPFTAVGWNVAIASGLIPLGVGGLAVWSSRRRSGPRRAVALSGFVGALAIVAGGALLIQALMPSRTEPAISEAAVAFRYQSPSGQFVLMEIAPFEIGENTFRITLLNEDAQPTEATSVTLQFSRLERSGATGEAEALRAPDKPSYVATYGLAETGWWDIDVSVEGKRAASFYLRLDNPSGAPLDFAPPDYESDPAAEALFRDAVERYEGLSTLRSREELTSGIADPDSPAGWVLTEAEAVAPDRFHLVGRSSNSSGHELYRIGERGCARDENGEWRCSTSEGSPAFDLGYLQGATAFRLGRRETVDGEMAQVLLFNNPSQAGAWFAWWVGEETGHLRRQAMVAPGHFMLTRFFDHDVSMNIEFPPDVRQAALAEDEMP